MKHKIQYTFLYKNGQEKYLTFLYDNEDDHIKGMDEHYEQFVSFNKMIKLGTSTMIIGAQEGDRIIVLSEIADITIKY